MNKEQTSIAKFAEAQEDNILRELLGDGYGDYKVAQLIREAQVGKAAKRTSPANKE